MKSLKLFTCSQAANEELLDIGIKVRPTYIFMTVLLEYIVDYSSLQLTSTQLLLTIMRNSIIIVLLIISS